MLKSVASLLICSLMHTHAAEKPNLVIIFTDDQGYSDLSCYGGGKHKVKTPNIDQMAKEGARLTSFYVAAPICTPSRASLMTGSYAKRVDMVSGVCLAADERGLNPDEITIAEVAQSAGYKTGMFGKWHLGDQPEFLPTRQGFEEFFGLPYSHDIHPYHGNQKKFNFPSLPLLEGEKVIELDPDADYFTKRFTERAIQFIKKNKDNPFFMYVAHPLPHRPIHASPPFMEDLPPAVKKALKEENGKINYKVRDTLYKRAVEEVDWSVGQIMNTLKAEGIDQNTIVLYTSDNGPKLGSSAPLSGGKGSILEGGMRMPTVIRWPERITAGKDNDQIMTTMDMLPTLAALIDAKLPEDRIIDGKDITATLTEGTNSPHQYFYYYAKGKLDAIRWQSWKLRMQKGKPFLVNLNNDIAEKKNVASANKEIVEKLRTQMKTFDTKLTKNIRKAGHIKKPKHLTK